VSADVRDVRRGPGEVPRDAVEVPRDAVEVPRDAVEVPRDAVEVPRDAVEVPRDAAEVPPDAADVRRSTADRGPGTVVVRSRAEFLAARRRLDGGSVGAVLTMGALHGGHEALLDTARAGNEHVVATVFVNPTQFGPTEDLSRYPRPIEADLTMLRRHGVDLVWTPAVEDVYPAPTVIGVDPGALGRELEGASRPTHFAGMLLVVAKFLHLVRPDSAYFGEKDYQQLTLVQAMVRDLELAVDIVGVPTVREDDGLARSSRNVFLNPEQRVDAAVLWRALSAGRAAGSDGPDAVLAAARAELTRARVEIDYLELRGNDLGPAPTRGSARLLLAARVGTTRLIDNVAVDLTSAGPPADIPADIPPADTTPATTPTDTTPDIPAADTTRATTPTDTPTATIG
jgi:pantoate--beta-alanine ligase